MQRLKEMQAFEKVYAPFDGVVTARKCRHRPVNRPGRERRELFHLQALGTLRVYTNVRSFPR